MTSLCDICPKPGNCCKKLTLSTGPGEYITFWKDDGFAAAEARMEEWKLPFVPIEINHTFTDDQTGSEYVDYYYSCPKLLPNGRCGIYDDRPALCRSYQPGADGLCVFHANGALRQPVKHGNRSTRQIKKLARSILQIADRPR